MKHSAYLAVLAAACFTLTTAQTPDTSWKHTGVASLAATQVAFTDWAQGGENAIAWTVRLEGKSEMIVPVWTWTNTYKFAFGQAKLGDKAIRKTDDKIDLSSVLTYKTGWAVNPY